MLFLVVGHVSRPQKNQLVSPGEDASRNHYLINDQSGFSLRETDSKACFPNSLCRTLSDRFFAFMRAWMSTKFGSDVENMKPEKLTEPDFFDFSFYGPA